MTAPTAWDICRTTGANGTGHWRAWDIPFDTVERAAESWRLAIGGVQKPWLCWNINPRWSLLQQKLIAEFGWTPVVGWDPNCRVRSPELVPGAIAIDFNAMFGLKALYPHIPLEFAFLWTSRLATWHADLILPRRKMEAAVALFERVPAGEMTAVLTYGGLRNLLRPRYHRYWEVLAFTTAEASRNQFENGCGWWRGFQRIRVRPRTVWNAYAGRDSTTIMDAESATGNGSAAAVSIGCASAGSRAERFSATTLPKYRHANDKGEEMDLNFDLDAIARRFGLADLMT